MQSLKSCNTCWFAKGFANLGLTIREKLKVDSDVHVYRPEGEKASPNTFLFNRSYLIAQCSAIHITIFFTLISH